MKDKAEIIIIESTGYLKRGMPQKNIEIPKIYERNIQDIKIGTLLK